MTPRRGQFGQMLDLLRRNADFRRLFLASIVSFMGDWFAFVAVSGLVKDLTGHDGAPALILAAEVLPVFLVSPLSGVLADRFDRKRLMVSADLARIGPALLLVVASATSQAWLCYVAVVLLAVLGSVFLPASSAGLPNLVDPDDLPLAQTMLGSVWGSMLFVGAGLGGLFTAAFGREASFLFDGLTFAVSALLVLRITRPLRTGAALERASVFTHLGEVWAFVRPRKVTKAFMVTKTGTGLGNGIVGLLPVYALDRFGSGDAGIGVLLAARGVGALIGPYFARSLIRSDGRRHIAACGIAIVVYALGYLVLPVTASLVVAAIAVGVAHAGGGSQWMLSTMGLQITTPDSVRGRVMSLDFGFATLATGLSSLLAAALAETIGLTATSFVLAGIALTYGLSWLAWTRDLWGAATDPMVVVSRAPVEVAVPAEAG